MLIETAKLWLDAVIGLGKSPDAIINCPECKTGTEG
jgi:hypothetical protein